MRLNRREVYMGYSLQEFNKVLDILAANKIKYFYRKVGMGGVIPERAVMYYAYVRKKDAEKA